MAHVPYGMWVGYYQLLQSTLGVSHRNLLDVCCGTGIVAELLHDEGYRVTGFDLSADMIEQAKAKGLDINFHVADAATVNLNETFDGAYSFFDSLNYITDPDRLQMAIQRVSEHLEPGGSFIFDVNTAYAFEQKMFDQKEKRAKAPIKYEWTGNYDPSTRLIHVEMQFERNGEKFREVHVQRAYETSELLHFLERAGFENIHVYDGYTLQPQRKRSDRLHFAAVKG